ncbi:MAG: co-chaperone GroES [Candidatus Woesebacteria bacterium]|jgi:chaperonin GroES
MSAQIKVSQLKPLSGYILVEPAKSETKTAAGIYLPENDSDKPQHGKVLACGASVWESGVKEIKCPVKKGDQVIYKKWGGNDVKIDDVEYQFLKFDDVLAVIK